MATATASKPAKGPTPISGAGKPSGYKRVCPRCGSVTNGTVGSYIKWVKQHRVCVPGSAVSIDSPAPFNQKVPTTPQTAVANTGYSNTVHVDAVTLGTFCDAYSADRIAGGKTILAVKYEGQLYTVTSCTRGDHAHAYRLWTRDQWEREDYDGSHQPISYADQVRAHGDRPFDYHGIKVTYKKQEHVLSGPCIVFAVEMEN